MSILVRHPGPEVTESPLGYALRLAEANGYGSPWNLYQFAGMKQNEVRTTGFAVEKLCAVTTRSLAELRRISYVNETGEPHSCRLLGHELAPIELDLKNPKVCRFCVMEKGFIEAYWDLALMIGCPLHRCSAVNVCARCGKRLRWYRKGLLACSCENDLQDAEVRSLSGQTSALLSVIRCVVMRETVSSRESHGLPADTLAGMELRSLLQIVRLLGRYRVLADGMKNPSDRVTLVNRSAHVLSEWPNNFFHLLDDLERSQGQKGGSGVRSHFSGLYTAVFKRSSSEDVSFLGLVREAFLDYLTQRWTGGAVHGNLLKRFPGKASKRYLSASEISARYDVQPRTARRFLSLHRASLRLQDGSSRVLIDSREAALRNTVPGRILRAREAARALGLSVPLLQYLRKTGLFEVNHLFPSKPGYHERDVKAFKERIAGLVSITGGAESVPKRFVSLLQVLKNPHTSVELKAAVLRGLFAGRLQLVGSGDKSTPHGFIDREVYDAFVRETAEQLLGHRSTRAAARELGCEPECIPHLVREGQLRGVVSPAGLRVTVDSIKALRACWISLATLAKAHRTSSRALRQRCEVAGISLLLVPSRPKTAPRPFIHVDQVRRMMATETESSDCATSQPNNLLPIGDDTCVTFD
ncbi:MAG TPA: TniQ family protein [Acidobacteriaceae bacterium]|nr:TniQ family protein [Acidobacteriaceae bacterium]